jgi:hypothetical protein
MKQTISSFSFITANITICNTSTVDAASQPISQIVVVGNDIAYCNSFFWTE